MAVLIPEAAGAVTAGESAVAGTATAARTRAGASQAAQAAPGLPSGGKGRDRARKAGKGALSARVPGGRNYQPVILAEFVVAVLVIALAPIAKQSQSAQGSVYKTPYNPDHLKQLVGAGAVYFVLALFSGGRHGRIAAWFGGLVLVGIGFAETKSGGLKAVFDIFKPGAPPPDVNAAGTPAPPDLQDSGGATFVPVPDATGSFPVINPSTTQSGGPLPGITQGPPPGVAASDTATQATISPPPGGNGVITT